MNITGYVNTRSIGNMGFYSTSAGAFYESDITEKSFNMSGLNEEGKGWRLYFDASKAWTGEKLFCSNYFVD